MKAVRNRTYFKESVTYMNESFSHTEFFFLFLDRNNRTRNNNLELKPLIAIK